MGHRKVWAMGHDEGWDLGSPSSVGRAMARQGLLQPVHYQAQRRQVRQTRGIRTSLLVLVWQC